MRLSLIMGLLLIAASIAFPSTIDTVISNDPAFYEKGPDSIVRFFYDDHYYLVDKHCQFKAIERVGRYDFQRQRFEGEFADFDSHGRVILEGNYDEGKKEGNFKAYHPNGQLKWEIPYIQGTPHGLLKFFYPDGKPLLEVMYNDSDIRILNFWDRRGRQRVADANGRYEFEVAADGYNEFGYVRYIRKGKVVDGYPHDNWTIEYLFADGKKQNAGYEYYKKGRFLNGYEAYTGEEFFDVPRYQLLPLDLSNRADAMIVKGCTIDDYTGFTGYLAEYLSDWFDGALDEIPDPSKIEFMVPVKKSGEPGRVEMKATFDTKRYADLLLVGLNRIGFWYPSYADGEYVDDKLTVTIEAFPDIAERKLRFFEVIIKRENGM